MHYTEYLEQAFKRAEQADKAIFAINYMRNQFGSYGINSQQRKEIYAQHFKKNGLPAYPELFNIVTYCWEKHERDYQYFAMELIAKMKKEWQEDIFFFFENLIEKKSWWDSIDFISLHLLRDYFRIFPESKEERMLAFANSENIWKKRSSIIFQLLEKEQTDLNLLLQCIELNLNSKEFFVQKAIGWALRQYSKTNAEWVIMQCNSLNLKPLSRREALKWLERRKIKTNGE